MLDIQYVRCASCAVSRTELGGQLLGVAGKLPTPCSEVESLVDSPPPAPAAPPRRPLPPRSGSSRARAPSSSPSSSGAPPSGTGTPPRLLGQDLRERRRDLAILLVPPRHQRRARRQHPPEPRAAGDSPRKEMAGREERVLGGPAEPHWRRATADVPDRSCHATCRTTVAKSVSEPWAGAVIGARLPWHVSAEIRWLGVGSSVCCPPGKRKPAHLAHRALPRIRRSITSRTSTRISSPSGRTIGVIAAGISPGAPNLTSTNRPRDQVKQVRGRSCVVRGCPGMSGCQRLSAVHIATVGSPDSNGCVPDCRLHDHGTCCEHAGSADTPGTQTCRARRARREA
jgi:hypothetical protein